MQKRENNANRASRTGVCVSAIGVVAAAMRRQAFRRYDDGVTGVSWSSSHMR